MARKEIWLGRRYDLRGCVARSELGLEVLESNVFVRDYVFMSMLVVKALM